jgi:hypothetical protein
VQERSTSSDIREVTHQLSVMEDRIVELREEEDELEGRRQKHLDGDEDEPRIEDESLDRRLVSYKGQCRTSMLPCRLQDVVVETRTDQLPFFIGAIPTHRIAAG